MKRSSYGFVGEDGHLSSFDGRLIFGAKGDLYKQFSYILMHKYVVNATNEFRDSDDLVSDTTQGKSSVDVGVQ